MNPKFLLLRSIFLSYIQNVFSVIRLHFRLYSSAVYSDFEKFSAPEILTKPVDQLVLHLKSMNIVKVIALNETLLVKVIMHYSGKNAHLLIHI